MPGVKGRSGRKDIPAGPGRLPKKFTLEIDGKYGLSSITADGNFLPIQGLKVIEVNRKAITLEASDGTKLTIFR